MDPSLAGAAGSVLLISYNYFFLFYLADWMDNRIAFRFRTLPLMIGGFVANAIVGAFMQVGGLIKFRDQQHWVKTDHAIAAQTVTTRECSPQLRRKVA
jgi:hypothetical protein